MATIDKLRGGKSVLLRTKPGKDLPKTALYVGIGGPGHVVREPDGTEHSLTAQVLTSHYKVASGSKAKALIVEHWAPKEEEPAKKKTTTKNATAKKNTTKKKTTKKP